MIVLEDLEKLIHTPEWSNLVRRKEYKEAIRFYTSFLPESASIPQRNVHIREQVYETMKCEFCRKNRNTL